jgi:hypothetical protein
MSTAIDIATYLQAHVFGTIGTDIFYGFLPDDPDNAICVFDTSGRPSEINGIDQPNFQITVRNTSYATASSTIESIQSVLQYLTNTTINGQFYMNINNLQAPFSAGWDGQEGHGRIVFRQNYLTQKR